MNSYLTLGLLVVGVLPLFIPRLPKWMRAASIRRPYLIGVLTLDGCLTLQQGDVRQALADVLIAAFWCLIWAILDPLPR